MKKYILLAISFIATTALCAQETEETIQKWLGSRPDGHAPISIMGDHTHGKGEWMLSYRYMSMNMEGLRQETNDISNTIAHDAGYMVTPIEMPMKMHMIGLMYAPSNKLTLIIMTNVIENEMDLQMRNMTTGMIMPFSTKSSGLGDIKVKGLFKLFNKNSRTMHANIGVSIPTGSIDAKDDTPMSNGNVIVLPYPMQIGSGTLDADLGITYLGQSNMLSWGHQLNGLLRLGDNNKEYHLGNQYKLNNWLAVKTNNWLSLSARIEGVIISKINGVNPELNPMMVTTADTNNSGGTFINSGFGFNTYVHSGALKNLRFGFEIAFPIYQNFNGIQLKNKETITLGTQYSF